jgi:hypothetical protein
MFADDQQHNNKAKDDDAKHDNKTLPLHHDPVIIQAAKNYKAQPGDIFVVTYHKSGTTWMATIVYGLLNHGRPFNEDMSDFLTRTVHLEKVGPEGIAFMRRPGVIKTHLSFNDLHQHPQAKYIVVIRNPKDVYTSFYLFISKLVGSSNAPNNFDEFLDKVLDSHSTFGVTYFEHLRATWQHKDDKNVLLVSYEQMKADSPRIIRQVAQFLDIELTNDLLERVVKYSSFNYMKEHYDKANRVFYAQPESTIAQTAGPHFAAFKKRNDELNKLAPDREVSFVREGKVHNWASFITEEQSRRLDKIIAEETRDLRGLDAFFNVSNTSE